MEDVYNHIKRYENLKKRFTKEGTIRIKGGWMKINPVNKKLALDYIKFKEEELTDMYGTSDDARVRNCKTLYKHFTTYLSNALYWFNDVDLNKLDEKKLVEVYRNIERGKLTGSRGRPLSDRTLKDIYQRVFKNGFFKYIGKDEIAHGIVKRKISIIKEVRFFDLETLKKIVALSTLTTHRLAYWLLYDTGIEVSAVVQLRKSHFELKHDDHTKTDYFMVHVPKLISKKGRRIRNNYIHFNETNELLKAHLETIGENDKLFNFSPVGLYRALKRLNKKKQFTVRPNGEQITIKDFRSSCATYFLQHGWTTDEVKARLGHAPSSDEIDRYVNYLGINQRKRREKDLKIDFNNYKDKYDESQETIRKLQADQDMLKAQLDEIKNMILGNAMKEINGRV